MKTYDHSIRTALIACALVVSSALAFIPGMAHAEADALTAGGVAEGALASHADGWEFSDDAWHYWEDGAMVLGRWFTPAENPPIEGIDSASHECWIDQNGALAQNRVIDPEAAVDAGASFCAYATEFGYFSTGKTIVGNLVYLAKENGELESGNDRGILDTKAYDGRERRYIIDQEKHAAVTGEVVNVAGWGKAYAFSGKGYIVQGVTKIDDAHVLLADKYGRLLQKKGWVSTKKYTKKSQRYYLEPSTANANVYGARTGLFSVKGWGKAYANPTKGFVVRGVKKIDATHVLLADKRGKLCKQKKGWLTTKKYDGASQLYRIERTKKNKSLYGARIGKFKLNGKLYYAKKQTGALVRNAYKRLGTTYYRANGKGALTKNNVITRMYRKAQGYSSPSRYLILVDTDDTKFMVLEGSQGKWKTKYIWDCSTGAPSTPTVLGVYHVGIKGYSFGHGYTCYYYTQFHGDYLIHTRIYREGTHILQDGAMNTRVSQGCVRLYDEDAYWVWKNIPEGTTVVTFV